MNIRRSKQLYLVRYNLSYCSCDKCYIYAYSPCHATQILIRYLHEDLFFSLDEILYDSFDITNIQNFLK